MEIVNLDRLSEQDFWRQPGFVCSEVGNILVGSCKEMETLTWFSALGDLTIEMVSMLGAPDSWRRQA